MRIVFFMAHASRTGSEIALCNLIWHAVNNGIEACVACGEGGELLEQLPPNVPVFVYDRWDWPKRAYAGISRRLRGDGNGFSSLVHSRFAPDVWYVNTIIQADYIREAKQNDIKCVLHSHELDHMLTHVSKESTATLVSYPQLVVANSNASREVLKSLGRRDDIEVCYPTIDPLRIKPDDDNLRKLKQELAIGDQTFVWAMAGTLDPNKNPARFVAIAVELLSRGHDVHFIWLGSGDDGYSAYVKQKAQNSGFAEKITFSGARTDDYYDWLNVANAVVITSFKESFSLVAVEAAYLGKPVVSFDSGGVKEIVNQGMGIVIDSWNDADLIQAMEQMMSGDIPFDPVFAKNRVHEFSIEVQGQRWLDLLTKYFGS
jgi:glycosyltransferase involved in cell wall biosynthesis